MFRWKWNKGVLVQLMLIITLLAACSSAGAGGGDAAGDAGSDEGAPSGGDSVAGTITMPAGVLDVAHLEFNYSGSGNTEVYFWDDTYSDSVQIAYVFDATDDIELESGTYLYDGSRSGVPQTFDNINVGLGTYEASDVEFFDPDDLITGGTLTVSRVGSVYTITISLNLEDGGEINGSVTGPYEVF